MAIVLMLFPLLQTFLKENESDFTDHKFPFAHQNKTQILFLITLVGVCGKVKVYHN